MSPTRRAPPHHSAYVLHRWDWSETSLIVDLFTREQGRVAIAAKGAKRPYSQLRGVLLPFQRLAVSLGRAPDEQAEVLTLRHAEWGGQAAMLDGAAAFSGFYLNELLMKLMARHDPHPQLFDAYADTLQALQCAADDAGASAVLRAFELRLLRETGVLPQLDRVTTSQQTLQQGMRYQLRAEHGLGIAAHDGAAPDAAQWRALQSALDASSMDALRAAAADAGAALRPQLRQLLHYHLGSSTLRSRQVAREAQRLIDHALAGAK